MQDFLNSILDFITSEKVAYVLSLIAALYIPVSKIVSSIANKKLEKKILNKDALLKVVKNEYETYLKDTNNIIKEISEKYLEAKETVEKVNNILQKQNEALEIAFNNSNLNASAKLLVSEILKTKEETKTVAKEDEIIKDEQIPISNAVKMGVVEEKENGKKEIRRVK
jgi:hypothetical protein